MLYSFCFPIIQRLQGLPYSLAGQILRRRDLRLSSVSYIFFVFSAYGDFLSCAKARIPRIPVCNMDSHAFLQHFLTRSVGEPLQVCKSDQWETELLCGLLFLRLWLVRKPVCGPNTDIYLVVTQRESERSVDYVVVFVYVEAIALRLRSLYHKYHK